MDMPMNPAEPQELTKAAGETELCIKIGANGDLSVYGEGAAQMPEQPAADIGQALKLLLDAYRGMGSKDGQDGEGAFDAGFSGQPQDPMQRRMGR